MSTMPTDCAAVAEPVVPVLPLPPLPLPVPLGSCPWPKPKPFCPLPELPLPENGLFWVGVLSAVWDEELCAWSTATAIPPAATAAATAAATEP